MTLSPPWAIHGFAPSRLRGVSIPFPIAICVPLYFFRVLRHRGLCELCPATTLLVVVHSTAHHMDGVALGAVMGQSFPCLVLRLAIPTQKHREASIAVRWRTFALVGLLCAGVAEEHYASWVSNVAKAPSGSLLRFVNFSLQNLHLMKWSSFSRMDSKFSPHGATYITHPSLPVVLAYPRPIRGL